MTRPRNGAHAATIELRAIIERLAVFGRGEVEKRTADVTARAPEQVHRRLDARRLGADAVELAGEGADPKPRALGGLDPAVSDLSSPS